MMMMCLIEIPIKTLSSLANARPLGKLFGQSAIDAQISAIFANDARLSEASILNSLQCQ